LTIPEFVLRVLWELVRRRGRRPIALAARR